MLVPVSDVIWMMLHTSRAWLRVQVDRGAGEHVIKGDQKAIGYELERLIIWQ